MVRKIRLNHRIFENRKILMPHLGLIGAKLRTLPKERPPSTFNAQYVSVPDYIKAWIRGGLFIRSATVQTGSKTFNFCYSLSVNLHLHFIGVDNCHGVDLILALMCDRLQQSQNTLQYIGFFQMIFFAVALKRFWILSDYYLH